MAADGAPSVGSDPMWKRILWAVSTTVLWGGLHFLGLLAIYVTAVGMVSGFVAIAVEPNSEIALPAMSILTIQLCSWFTNYGYLRFVAWFVIDLPLLFGASLLPSSYRWMAAAWSYLVLFGEIVWWLHSSLSISLMVKVWA